MVRFNIYDLYDFVSIEYDKINSQVVQEVCLKNRRMIYVTKDEKLFGFIGWSEANSFINNGGENIINRKGTSIIDSETSREEAVSLFSHHMNWSGIPVTDSEGHILYEYCIDQEKYYHDYVIPEGEGVNRIPRDEKIVVSMTSHDERLQTVYLALKSIMIQTMKADEIVLYLANGSGDGEVKYENMLKEAGVKIIRGKEDIKCHKKYYYAMQEYRDSVIITADDDNIYDDNFISDLYDAHLANRDSIICKIGDRIGYENGNVLPYILWNDSTPSVDPEYQICLKSAAGVLYPVGDYREFFLKIDLFTKLCEYNDDLWITACAQEMGVSIFNIGANYSLPIRGTELNALWSDNGTAKRNDYYVNELRSYFKRAFRRSC